MSRYHMEVTACEPNTRAQLIYTKCETNYHFLGANDLSHYQSTIGGVLINSYPYY